MSKEVFLEKHLELQDEPKISTDKKEKTESTDAANQECPGKISLEEQSDSDIVEDQERRDDIHEGVVEQYFEEQEEIKGLHDETVPSVMRNENFIILESCTAPVTISYEEQEDPGIPLDAEAQDIISDIHTEREQNIQDVDDLPESTSVLTTAKISRHATAIEVKISPRPPKKRSGPLIDEIAAESEDNIASIANESLHKKISYEEENETDPTSTEIDKAVVCHLEMKLANTCKGLSEEEGNTSNFVKFMPLTK